MNIGSITITHEVSPEGRMLTTVHAAGNMPLVTKLGLLELAKDTILNGPDEDDE